MHINCFEAANPSTGKLGNSRRKVFISHLRLAPSSLSYDCLMITRQYFYVRSSPFYSLKRYHSSKEDPLSALCQTPGFSNTRPSDGVGILVHHGSPHMSPCSHGPSLPAPQPGTQASPWVLPACLIFGLLGLLLPKKLPCFPSHGSPAE